MKNHTSLFRYLLLLLTFLSTNIQSAEAQGTLNLKFYIQGYYLGSGLMNTPYYNSNLSSNSTDVGFCTIDLIDPQSCLVVESMQGMLQLNGQLSTSFISSVGSTYYIRVSHHNTIAYYSNPVSLGSTTSYDFSISGTDGCGGNLIEVETGIWAFYSGDINQDCIIDAQDLNILNDGIFNFFFGYEPTDLNGDGTVDQLDLILFNTNANTIITCCSPCSQATSCSIFGDDYSSNTGWIQVGTDITVNSIAPGQVKFNAVPGNSDHRVYKNLGVLGNTWMTEFDFQPVSGSSSGVAVMLMCLSAGNDIPYRNTPNGTFTDQDFISVELSSPLNPIDYLSETSFAVGYKDGANAATQSTLLPIPAWNVRYFARLERFDATTGLLSVFSDAARTMHISGSPVCLTIPSTITGLTTLQHSNVNQAGAGRNFTGELDNTCISATTVNKLTAEIVSTDHPVCVPEGCFHINYTGMAPFTFSYTSVDPINATSYTSPTSSSSSIFCNVPSGIYTLYVTDACGNTVSLNGQINSATQLTADAGPDIINCDPGNAVMLNGGPPISGTLLTWTPIGLGSILAGQGTTTPLVSGIDCYQLVVLDPLTNCSDTDTVCIVNCPAEALDFDGVDDYVSLGNRPELRPSNELTVEVWLHQSDWATVPDKTIIGNTQNGGYSLEFDPGNMLSSWVHRNGTYGIASYNCSGLSSGWHHLAMTYDGQVNRLFVDGIMVASDDAGAVFQIDYSTFDNSTILGAEAFTGDEPEPNSNCPGKYDELRIWSYARNCGEIMTRKNCELTGVEGGLIAYYRFNQGIDAGNNTNEVTLDDATSLLLHGQLRNFARNGPTSNWIAPGAVPSGITCSGLVVSPEIDVQGNSVSIQLGDNTPDLSDDTEFGDINTNASVTHTFTIFNTGSDELNISGMSVTGSDFTVSGLSPASPIPVGGSSSFTVTFSPASLGLKSAIVHVMSNDCNEPDFDFTIQGTGTGCCTGNFIQNPGFTDGLNTSGNIDGGSTVTAWNAAAASPQIIITQGCEDVGYVRMWGNQFTGESIRQTLTTPILSGHKYRLCFCARWNDVITPPTADQFVRFLFRASNINLPDNSTINITGDMSVIATSINITNTGTWVTYELPDWTADADYSMLTISATNATNVNDGGRMSWGEIDNICLSLSPCDNFPQVDAGADQTICAGACATLSSPAYAGTNSAWYQLPNFDFIGNGTSVTVCPTSNTCYALIVSGPFGCADTDEVCIVISDLNVSCNKTDVTCNGINDGSVCVTVQCGTAPYVYTLLVGGNPSPAQASPCMYNLAPGEYCVLVTDAVGNTASCCFTVTEPNPIIADAGPDATFCGNNSIILTALGNGITRDWYRLPGNIHEGSGATITVHPTVATCYEVIETDANGCTASDIVCIGVNSPPIAIWPISFGEYCSDALPFALTGGIASTSIGSGTVSSPGIYSGDGVILSGMFHPELAPHRQNTVYYTISNECGSSVVSNTIFVRECPCDSCHTEGADLIVNGDFESGNSGFLSGYTNSSDLSVTNRYAVTENPSSVNALFSNCTDHTSGNGKMLVVNSATLGGEFWQQNVTVNANKNYVLTFYTTSVSNSYTNIRVLLSSDNWQFGPSWTITTLPCDWLKFEYEWNSGSYSGILALSLFDWSGSGSDFAIDDISFIDCEKTVSASWPLSLNPVCSSTPEFTLTGGEPQGGYYTGPGVFNDINGLTSTFDPSLLAPGTYTLYYIYQDPHTLCADTVSNTITVLGPPTINLTGPIAVCKNDPNVTLTATPSGGVFSGSYTSGAGVFNPSTAPAGTYTITYTYQYATNCFASATKTIKVVNCGICGLCSHIGPELIVDHDFGHTYRPYSPSFQSELPWAGYTYGPDMCDNGTWILTTNAKPECNRLFKTVYDHTTGNNYGNFLLINGHKKSPKVVWSQSVNVEKGKTYRFSFWVNTDIRKKEKNDPFLRVWIGGIPHTLGTISTSGWYHTTEYTWTAPANYSSKKVKIEIQQINYGRKDFIYGIDDISFKTCEPNILKVDVGPNVSQLAGQHLHLTANVTPPVGQYTYSWSPGGQTTQSIDVYPTESGNYICTVTDENGCVEQGKMYLEITPGKKAVDPVSCNGSSNGAIHILDWTGTAPFTYQWSNGATTADITGLQAGTYYVTVTDSNGVVTSDSAVVSSPDPIQYTVDAGTACPGEPTGYLSLEVSGGTPPYDYLWNTGDSSEYIYNVPLGNYSVSVSDANGCTVVTPGNFTVHQAGSCIGSCCDAGNDLVQAGQITFDNAVDSTSDFELSCVCDTSTYCVTSNANLKCNSFNSVIANINPTFLAVQGSPTVPGKKIWSAKFDVQAGSKYAINALFYSKLDSSAISPIFCYKINNQIINCFDSTFLKQFEWQAGGTCYTADTTGLVEFGIYQLNTGGAYGIDDILLYRCTPILPPVVSSDLNIDVCQSSVLPTYTLTYTAYYPPGDILWEDGFIGPIRTNLTPGVYPFIIEDSLGFSTYDSLVINESLPIQVTATINNTCPGVLDGSIQLQTTGGTGPYTYLWSNGTTTQDITSLDVGNYSVTIGDANGCSALSTHGVTFLGTCMSSCNCAINLVTELDFNTTPITPIESDMSSYLGCGNSTYLISANAMDKCNSLNSVVDYPSGTGNFIIAEGFTSIATSKRIWYHTFSVEAGKSYYLSADIYLKLNPLLEPLKFSYVANGHVLSTFDSASFHEDNATVTEWHNIGTCFVSHITGSIEVSIDQENSGGAFGIDNIRWWECPEIVPSVGIADPVQPCPGSSDGVLRGNFWYTFVGETTIYPIDTANRNGFSWLWNTGATTSTISNLVAGTYEVTITSPSGNTASASYVLMDNTPVSITIDSVHNVSCNGGFDGYIGYTATGGSGIYTYRIESVGSTLCCVNLRCGDDLFCIGCYCESSFAGPFPNIGAATYIITVTDNAGCSATQTVTLTEPPVLEMHPTSSPILCFSGSTCVGITASGGTAPYTGTGLFCGIGGGTTQFSITDAIGCISDTTITLIEPAKIEATFNVTPANCGQSNGSLSTIATGGTPPYQYSIDGSPYQAGPTFSALGAGNYSVSILDANGCIGTGTIYIPTSGLLPATPGVILGPAGACRNQNNIVFSIAPVSGADSYHWILPPGVSGSSTGTSISLNFGSGYSGGFICVEAVNTCGTGSSSCMNIPVFTVRPSQPGFIIGTQNPCGPNVYSYSITPLTNAGSYNWSVAGTGVAIMSGQGSNSVSVSFPVGFGQGSISVNASNCVGTTSTRTLTLTGIPANGNALSGPAYTCANTFGVAYAINPVIGTSGYAWSTTGDMTIAGSSGPSCTVNFGPSFTTGTLNVTTTSLCGSFVKSYTIKSVPGQPGSISGPGNNLCGQTGVTYSIAAIASATSYNWTVPAGASIITNTGTSITVNFGPLFTGTGTICVSAVSACGSSPARCYSVSAAPAIPLAISGPTTVCKTATGVSYSIAPIAGATYYSWFITDGASINAQGIGLSALADFTFATSSSLTVRVKSNNSCNSSALASKVVAVNLGCRESGNPDELGEDAFRVYPNPTQGKLQIDFIQSNQQLCIFTVTDLLGNTIDQFEVKAEAGFNSVDIDLSSVSNGMYFIQLERDGIQKQKQKIAVQ